MTLAITPISTTNKLRIDVVVFVATADTGGNALSVALFQDTTAGALAAGSTFNSPSADDMRPVVLTHYMAAGTTSSTTFKVRAGGQSNTLTFNGAAAARIFGGVCASSITITEIEA